MNEMLVCDADMNMASFLSCVFSEVAFATIVQKFWCKREKFLLSKARNNDYLRKQLEAFREGLTGQSDEHP